MNWFVFALIIGLLCSLPIARAQDQSSVKTETPEILAALNSADAVTVDDSTAVEVRGQATGNPTYRMVKIWTGAFSNTLDSYVNNYYGATWVNYYDALIAVVIEGNWGNWRYGNWGGGGWSNGKAQSSVDYTKISDPAVAVDSLDNFFRAHDRLYANGSDKKTADLNLLNSIKGLKNYSDSFWGSIYVSSPSKAPGGVKVYFGSFYAGGKIFRSRNMAFSEYARRQAGTAFSVKRFQSTPYW
jgi:hypothetical protein